MARSARHLYPEWLRPWSAPGAPGGEPGAQRQPDGAAQILERFRAFDRRYAGYVDVALAGLLFVLCSGWLIERGTAPNLWLAAALILPLIFRRRAPMTVFLVISAVALVQYLVASPALADAALLVALYTVALESQWFFVVVASVILEAGVVMATISWTPTGNDLKSFVFLTGLAFAGAARRHRDAGVAQPARLAGRAHPAARDRAGPTGVAGRRGGASPHRAGDARCRVTQHPGDGDPGRRCLGRGRRLTPGARRRRCTRCRRPDARP